MSEDTRWLDDGDLEALAAALRARGHAVIGPRVEDGSPTLAELGPDEPVPAGWHDDAAPGRYRVTRAVGDTPAARERFGIRVGGEAWKRFLHPPEIRLARLERDRRAGFRLDSQPAPGRPLAFLGVRPCDLAAIRVQDRVLMEGDRPDPVYAARRRPALVVAVECTRPGGTCFCASQGTGPAVADGFDLALTELCDERRHGFVARSGSERGHEVLAALGARPASGEEIDARARALEEATRRMGRSLDGASARVALADGAELPLWQDVGERCLRCGNCTLVCPTCFCTTVRDLVDLDGRVAERHRSWDSCFGLQFSHLHGGSVRQSGASRYRQWITHKLSGWFEQFGESGCVGCGRCITWCPVGIDITREAEVAVRQAATAPERGGRAARPPIARKGGPA